MRRSLDEEFNAEPDAQAPRTLEDEFDAEADASVGGLESVLEGAKQGLTLGLGDEMGALLEAGLLKASGDPRSMSEQYRLARELNRREMKEAQRANPAEFIAGEVGGGLLLPGGAAKGAGTAAKALTTGQKFGQAAKMGAGLGAGYGAGTSEADLLEGDVGGFALDTAIGAGAGVLGGVAGEGMGQAAGYLGRKMKGAFQRGSDDAMTDLVAQKTEAVDKGIRSQKSEFGAAVADPSRGLDVMRRARDSLPPGPERDAIEAFLASPAALDLEKGVALNQLSRAPEQLAKMTEKRAAYEAAVAGKPAAVQSAVDDALQNFGKKQVKPRLATLGHRFLPAIATGAIGAAIGGSEGAGIGAGVGSLLSLGIGRPGVIIRNLIRSPEVRHKFYNALLRLTGGNQQKAAGLLRPLMAAEQRGDRALATTAYVLSQKSPEMREALRLVASSEGPTEPKVASAP